MDIWAKIAQSQATGRGGVYLKQGNFIVRIDAVEQNRSRKLEDMFIVEMTVAHSNHPAIPVGYKPGWVVNLSKHESGPGNAKGFVAVCFGLDPQDTANVDAQIRAEVIAGICDRARQPMRGKYLGVTVAEQPTKGGGTYSKHIWAPIPAEMIPALDAALVSFPLPPLKPAPSAPQVPNSLAGAFAPPAPSFGGAASLPQVPTFGLPAAPGLPNFGAAMQAPGIPVPPPPSPPPVLPVPPVFPPPGWTAHPQAPGYFYRGSDVVSEADLRANPR